MYRELFQDQFPMGFTLGEKDAGLDGKEWSISRDCLPEYDLERWSTTLGESLRLELYLRRYRDADCLEWYLQMENISGYDSELISQVDIARFQVLFDGNTSPFFLDYNGSNEQMCDFMERRTQLFHRARRTLRCEGGRSSSVVMPYFNLLMEDYGYTFAIGWSGQWRAELVRPDDEGLVRFTAGMEDAAFRLHPGEKVTLPHMLVLYAQGDENELFNAYRRFAFAHIIPKKDGKPIEAPICMGTWGGNPASRHMETIELVKEHQLEIETYWIDAGWYGNVAAGNVENDGSWYRNAGIGDWQPSRSLYPRGMEEIADAVHAMDIGFLLWYEPERCRACARRVAEHPDWYVGVRSDEGDVMLDLGNDEAREWITGILSSAIERYDMQVLRIDFNYGPLPFWNYKDAQDRKGIAELRYVAGFYRMWDDLLERFPSLIIDNCASGGRRLDFEALRRSIPLFRTDYNCFGLLDKPTATQIHTWYLSRFAPVNSASVTTASMDTYRFRSVLAAGVNTDMPSGESPDELWSWYNRAVREAKRLRSYTTGDMWPLTGCSVSDQDWMAYQLNQPDQGRGVIVAYRREESQIRLMDVCLRDLEEEAVYELEDLDAGPLGQASGKELTQGWPFEILERRSCRMVFYNKVG